MRAMVLFFAGMICANGASAVEPPARKTTVSIRGQAFHVNGEPTYKGRVFEGRKVEGLLLNSRMVQGVFDDLNPETRGLWKYPGGAEFDAERNTREFVAAMPDTEEEQRFLAGLGDALGFDAAARMAIAQRHGLA